MSYCTNAADDGRRFTFCGADMIREALKTPEIPQAEKAELVTRERAAAADYYNWLFDRQQDLRGKEGQ